MDARLPCSSVVEVISSDGNVRCLHDIEVGVMCAALVHYNGRVSMIARYLGISRSSVYRKLGEMGLNSRSLRWKTPLSRTTNIGSSALARKSR